MRKRQQNRMTKQSRENVTVAERVELIPVDSGGYMIQVWRGDRSGIVHGADGPLVYKTAELARKAARRLNKRAEIAVLPQI